MKRILIIVGILSILFIAGCGSTKLTQDQICCMECINASTGSPKDPSTLNCATWLKQYSDPCAEFFESRLLSEQSVFVSDCKKIVISTS